MNAARALSEALRASGESVVFGNPGTTELSFLEGLDLRYVLTLHDGLAVGAADLYSQLTRRPAVVNLHAAPGLANAIGFLASARENRAPLLVTVGQQDRRHWAERPLLYSDLVRLATPVVKGAWEVTSVENLPETLDRAWQLAGRRPYGPTVVSLPMDLMESPSPPLEPFSRLIDPPPEGSLEEIAAILQSSPDPALVAGYQVDLDRVHEPLQDLAQRLGAPIFAEPLASRAPVTSECENFAGDLLPASALINSALGPYDPILLVGADLTLYPYTPSPLLPGKTVLYVGEDPDIGRRRGRVQVIGALGPILKGLLERVADRGRRFRRPRDLSRAGRIARVRARMGGEFILSRVAEFFSGFTVLDEAVSLTPALKGIGFYRGPDSYFSCRSGQMGWALAASVGAGVAGRPTLAVIGDGAFLYGPSVLATLAREGLGVKILVLNNHGYNILRSYARAFHPSLESWEALQIPPVDIAALSQAFGVPAESVSKPADLDPALRRLRDRDGPALLNVEVDPKPTDLFG